MAAFALKKVAYIRLESVADFIGIRNIERLVLKIAASGRRKTGPRQPVLKIGRRCEKGSYVAQKFQRGFPQSMELWRFEETC